MLGVDKMKKTTLPVGMHDKLFKRARVTYKIERDISDFLMSQGFNRIETPTLEHFEVFSDTITKNNYNFFDKSGEFRFEGRILIKEKDYETDKETLPCHNSNVGIDNDDLL